MWTAWERKNTHLQLSQAELLCVSALMTAFLPLVYDAKLTQSEFYMITKPHSTLHICTPVLISVLSVCKVYKTTFQHTVPMKLDFIYIF